MRRLRSTAVVAAMLVVGTLLAGGRLAPTSLAQTPADRSEVVLVLDFSASILEDVANRNRFAAALDRIADRIDATSADLIAGDATVSIVQFATRAADYTGCVELKLLDSPQIVARFADCLRSVAKAYRKGLDPALTSKIGTDTNYVAAMERAARHLPADSVRPALILLTDGKHDVRGVPIAEVTQTRDRLFGSRSPFALLPVGMGLIPSERAALERGVRNHPLIRDMPACVSGARFDWPQVVFESADDAGNAVAVALQDVTCTFTVAPPTSSPTPSATPLPTPGAVRGIALTPEDGKIAVTWVAPATTPVPIVDYRIRCGTGDGTWIESNEGASLETSAIVEGLTNGSAYDCEVAAVGATTDGQWTASTASATPVGLPAAPAKPAVQALDHAVRFQVPAQDPSLPSDYRYECSSDQGHTWPTGIDVPAAGATTAEIGNLTNGVEYVCRAFAANAAGVSDPSAVSDAVRPCGSLLECNPGAAPFVAILGVVGLGGLLLALFALYRSRTRGYVVAVVDVVHTANLGYGSRLGVRFERARPRGPVTGIVPDRSRKAELRIRQRRGDRFEVTDRNGRHVGLSGERITVVDAQGVPHAIVLRGFHTATASPVAGRR